MTDFLDDTLDLFEDAGEKIRKIDKKKAFAVAAIVAAVAGFIVWRRKTPETEYVETVIAGTGAADVLPTDQTEVDTGLNALVDEYNETLQDLQEQYNSEIINVQQLYSEQIQGVKSEYDYKLQETESYFSDQMDMLNEDVAQLQAEKEAAEKSIGSYDKSINYTKEIKEVMADGAGGASDKVSTLVISRAAKISAEEESKKYVNDYDKNVDYMAAINKAKAEGASQEVIDTLTSQREAKIRGEKLTQYYGDLTEDK